MPVTGTVASDCRAGAVSSQSSPDSVPSGRTARSCRYSESSPLAATAAAASGPARPASTSARKCARYPERQFASRLSALRRGRVGGPQRVGHDGPAYR